MDQIMHAGTPAVREAFPSHRSEPPGLRDLRPAQLVAILEYADRAIGLTKAAAVPSMLELLAQLVGA